MFVILVIVVVMCFRLGVTIIVKSQSDAAFSCAKFLKLHVFLCTKCYTLCAACTHFLCERLSQSYVLLFYTVFIY